MADGDTETARSHVCWTTRIGDGLNRIHGQADAGVFDTGGGLGGVTPPASSAVGTGHRVRWSVRSGSTPVAARNRGEVVSLNAASGGTPGSGGGVARGYGVDARECLPGKGGIDDDTRTRVEQRRPSE